MKKEVTVCDATCRTLADVVCVLCNRDVCNNHGSCTVTVAVTVERTGAGAGGSNVPTMKRQYDAPCCNTCAAEAASTILGSLTELLQPFNVQAIEYLRACFAAAKIKKGS